MAKDIGPRIGIDGEKEYRSAIEQIIQQAKTLDSEMRLVASGFDKTTTAEEKNAATQRILSEQIKTQEERVRLLKEQYAKAAETLGENDTKTLKWKQAVNDAESQLNGLNKQLDDLDDEMHDAGDETEKTGKKTKEAGEKAEDAGERFEKLGNVMGAVGKAAAATLAALAAGAVTLGKEVVQSFGELEQNLGGSKAVFGDYAKQIQQAGEEAYRKLGTSQSDYLATANKMGALLQGSGIEQQRSLELTMQAMQRATDMASVMGIDTQSALDAVTNAAKGNYTMMDNLGVAMNATTLGAYAVSAGFDKAFNKMSNAEKAEVAMQYFFNQTSQYAGNFEREATETVSGSLGLLTASVESFVAGLGNADADITNLAQNVVDSLVAVADNVTPVLQNLAAAAPEAINSFISSLQNSGVAGELLTAAGDIVSTLALGLVSALPQIGKAAVSIIETLLKGLISQTSDLGTASLNLVLEIAGVLLDNLDLILTSALTLVETLALGIADAAPELIPTVVDVALEMVDTLTAPDQLNSFINAALQLILALVEGVSSSAPRLYGEMPRLIIQLQTSLLASLPEILKVGVQIVMSLIAGCINSMAELLKTGRQIIDQVKAGFDEKLKNVGQWGKDLIRGFIDGILAKWNELKASVSNVVSSVKNLFTGKSGFDTHSPSKWAEDVFENVIAGAEKGIGAAAPRMIRSMQKAVTAVKDVVAMTASEAMTQAQYSAEQILSMAVGTIELDLAADLNGDGKVTAADAREALRLNAVFDDLSASFAGIAVPQAPVSAAAASSTARAEKVNENTYNYGGIYFTINAAEGQDPEEIAEIVSQKLQEEFEREEVVYK